MFNPKISYVLRELANWIEHRTACEPSDMSRIELARSMATKVEEFENELDRFKGALDHMMAEGPGKLFDAENAWTEAADGGPAPFLVGQQGSTPPVDPVKGCGCSTLTFTRALMSSAILATCNKGKITSIYFDRGGTNTTSGALDVAQRLANDHGLDRSALYAKLLGKNLIELGTITLGS